MTESLDARVARLEQQVTALQEAKENHGVHIKNHDARITQVEGRVNAQLVLHVQTDVASGMKSKEVAAKHNVSPQFVATVAPRRQFAPGSKPSLH